MLACFSDRSMLIQSVFFLKVVCFLHFRFEIVHDYDYWCLSCVWIWIIVKLPCIKQKWWEKRHRKNKSIFSKVMIASGKNSLLLNLFVCLIVCLFVYMSLVIYLVSYLKYVKLVYGWRAHMRHTLAYKKKWSDIRFVCYLVKTRSH